MEAVGLVKFLLCQHEGLSLIRSSCIEKPGNGGLLLFLVS